MNYYQNVQDANESRKKRIISYCEHIDTITKNQMSVLVHKLVERRKSLDMSQQDVAEATGMAAPNIARIESCKRIPTMQVLAKYADAVGMKLEIDVVSVSEEDNKD